MEKHEGDRRKLARKFLRKVRLPLHPLQTLDVGLLVCAVSVLPHRFLGLLAYCGHQAKGAVTLPKTRVKARILSKPRLKKIPTRYAAPLSMLEQFASCLDHILTPVVVACFTLQTECRDIISDAVVFACEQDQIPALHAADVQLSEQSLDVTTSEWSQTKTARRKQKRKGNTKQLNSLNADVAASSSAQEDAQDFSSIQDINGSIQSETSHDAAVRSSADAAVPLGNAAGSKQHGTVLMPRLASPLGKNKLGGLRGQTTRHTQEQQIHTGVFQEAQGQAQQAPQDQWAAVQPLVRQLDTQEDIDALVLVSKQTLYCMASLCTTGGVQRRQMSWHKGHTSSVYLKASLACMVSNAAASSWQLSCKY